MGARVVFDNLEPNVQSGSEAVIREKGLWVVQEVGVSVTWYRMSED